MDSVIERIEEKEKLDNIDDCYHYTRKEMPIGTEVYTLCGLRRVVKRKTSNKLCKECEFKHNSGSISYDRNNP